MNTIQPGQMLGPYRIIDQIGQGGMATVYKAYQPSMDRYVAIKVLPSQLAESKEFATRFQQEARIIARLEHPHILPVFDYGEDNGVAYFVMRYLEAGTLKDRMEAGRPLPLDEIDRIFTQLTDALTYAHSHGIVHRDLKPANVLIDPYGNVFLTDFGIAKLLESASPRLTQTDAILGTPAYISPEQAQAQPVDQRSDIYSLGIILYEMVTGGVPFVADTPLAVIFKHITDPLPLPSQVRPDVPPAIEKVILRALAKEPRDRFATAQEFKTAWKRALEAKETLPQVPDMATRAPLDTPRAQASIPVSRTSPKAGMRTLWIGGCLIALCAVFGLGGVALMASNLWSLSTPSVPPTQTADFIPATPPDPTVPVIQTGTVLLEDDFSVPNWGTLTDSDNAIEYDGQALRMRLFRQNWFVWSTANATVYENVHIEITATNNDGEPTTAFGILCHQQSPSTSYYYLGVTPGGEYAIVKASTGKDDVFLTNNEQWGHSDLIRRNASSYRVGADCGTGILTLYVDGQQIASVYDSDYTSGYLGAFTWSGENATSADVTFDNFLVTSFE